MRKGSGLLLAGAVLVSLAQAASAEKTAPITPRKNLLLITLDTTRADHVHGYGYALPTTPVLDRLAREGVLFLDAFTQAVNTVPSHATLFTGLYPSGHRSRLNAVPLHSEFETLATLLSKAGYRTGAFVSGSTMVAGQSGLQRGFEVYDDQFTGQDRRAEETVNRAVAWLQGIPGASSYFLFVHLFDPHGRYEPPPGHAEPFRTGGPRPIEKPEAIPEYQRLPLDDGSTSRDARDYLSRYDGEIHYADAQIGRLLKEAGEETLVAVVADHGETLLDRDYFFSHGARLNEEAIRVPLVLRFPGSGLRGKSVPGIVQMIDLLPTLLSALGRPVPPRLPGSNLLPFIRTGGVPAGRVVLSEGRASPQSFSGRTLSFAPGSIIVSARDEHRKLILYPSREGAFYEMFDLKSDPGEKTNLAVTASPRSSPLFQALDLYLATGRAPEPPELDEELKKKLRSLGYLN